MKKQLMSILLSSCMVVALCPLGMVAASAAPAITESGGAISSATWLLDPGHGGADPGAVCGTRRECDDNLRIAKEIGRLLELNGETVAYTRISDVTLELYERSQIENAGNYGNFLSVHRNSSELATANGVETYYYNGLPNTSNSALLAGKIQNELINTGLLTNRGVKSENFHVLRETICDAALVELGFITNTYDNSMFDQNFTALATAVAKGCLAQVGKTFNAGTPQHKIKMIDFFENPLIDIWGVSSSGKTASASFSSDNGIRITGTSNAANQIVRARFLNNTGSTFNFSGFDGIVFKVKKNAAHSGNYMGIHFEGDGNYAASVSLASGTGIQDVYVPFTSFKSEGATGEPSGAIMPLSELSKLTVVEIDTKYGGGVADYDISDIYTGSFAKPQIPANKVKLVDFYRNVSVDIWGSANGIKTAITSFTPDTGYLISATSNSANNIVRARFFNRDSRKFDFSGFNGIVFKVKKNASHSTNYMGIHLESDENYAATVSLVSGTGVQEVFVPFSNFKKEGATGEPAGILMNTSELSKINVIEIDTKYGGGVANYQISDIYGASYADPPRPDNQTKMVDFYSGASTDIWGVSSGTSTASTAFSPDSGKLISANSNAENNIVRVRFGKTGGYDFSNMNGITFKIKKNAAHNGTFISVRLENAQNYYAATFGFGSGTATREVFVPFSKFKVEGSTGEPVGEKITTANLSNIQMVEIDSKYGGGVAKFEISDIYGYSYAALEKPRAMIKKIDFSANPNIEFWGVSTGTATASTIFAPESGKLISASSNSANQIVRARFKKSDSSNLGILGTNGIYFKLRINPAHTGQYIGIRLESTNDSYAAKVSLPAGNGIKEVFIPYTDFRIEGLTGEPVGNKITSTDLSTVNIIEIDTKYGGGIANYEISDIYAATYKPQ